MKTLMVVSGGDAPGINAALLQYVALASARGDEVLGALGGLPGLLDNQIVPLTTKVLIPWLGRAGSYLQTSRDPVLSHEDAQNRLKAALRQHQIDNIVLFGGNGTLRYIPPLLERWRIPSVGIPTTIDNDVPGTELTLGFDSACNFAYHAIDGILATAHALAGRIFMVETLGGNTGYLALAIATGAAAHAVLVPEYPYTEDWLAERVVNAVNMHGYALIVLSEGTPGARTLVDTLPQRTQIRMRDVRLGHAQRGGIPSHRDRVLAAESARAAHDALHAGLSFGVTVVRSGQVVVHEGLLPETKSAPDLAQYKAINGL